MADMLDCVAVDSHPATLFGIRSFLAAQGIRVVAEASTVREGRLALVREMPRVLVTEVKLPDGNGFALAETAAAQQTNVVLFACRLDVGGVSQGHAVGVRGFVRKEEPLDILLDAIRAIDGGTTYVSPRLAAEVASLKPRAALTRRERDTLELLADGRSLDEIGKTLGISPATVRTHLTSARKRLGARTTGEAIAHALREALIA